MRLDRQHRHQSERDVTGGERGGAQHEARRPLRETLIAAVRHLVTCQRDDRESQRER
jgi:hypothetical protein